MAQPTKLGDLNHYARYLLESRMFSPDKYQDPFWAFTEAHKRLRSQILREKSATHPFRVAELYPEFSAALWERFDPRQRAVVRRMLAEMLGFLADAPMRYRAQKIEETRNRLAEWLEHHPGGTG
jgi:hypothetical protein